jgi:hypothetical protein
MAVGSGLDSESPRFIGKVVRPERVELATLWPAVMSAELLRAPPSLSLA